MHYLAILCLLVSLGAEGVTTRYAVPSDGATTGIYIGVDATLAGLTVLVAGTSPVVQVCYL